MTMPGREDRHRRELRTKNRQVGFKVNPICRSSRLLLFIIYFPCSRSLPVVHVEDYTELDSVIGFPQRLDIMFLTRTNPVLALMLKIELRSARLTERIMDLWVSSLAFEEMSCQNLDRHHPPQHSNDPPSW
jgi:hypothetical protein